MHMIETLVTCVISIVVAQQNECERMSCFTVKRTDKYIVLTCRIRSSPSNIVVFDPLGNIQANCGIIKNEDICFPIPGVLAKFYSKFNQVVLTWFGPHDIPDGKWVCKHETEQITLDLNMSAGMLQSTDIGLKISMTPMRDFYIFKLECFSCWRPYGDHVEFHVNDVSIDELRKYDGMCFHTQIRCNPKICRCCDDSNIYIIEHRTNDLTNIRSFSCQMRFKDIFTTEMKRQNVSIPFNRQSYFGNHSDAKVYDTTVVLLPHQEITEKPVDKINGVKKTNDGVTTSSASTLIILAVIIVQRCFK